MVAKGKCRAAIRRRKPDSRNSEIQEWGLVELAPPTEKAKPGVLGSLYPRIVRNARKDEKAKPPVPSERQATKSNHLNSS
jgi:hypothetical protein